MANRKPRNFQATAIQSCGLISCPSNIGANFFWWNLPSKPSSLKTPLTRSRVVLVFQPDKVTWILPSFRSTILLPWRKTAVPSVMVLPTDFFRPALNAVAICFVTLLIIFFVLLIVFRYDNNFSRVLDKSNQKIKLFYLYKTLTFV